MSILNFRRKDNDLSSATTLRSTTVTDDGVDDPRGVLGLNLLYSPSKPLIEFIFVDGLGGGSRKTWSKTNSVSHYWPQAWLPKDPAFKNVRVHSFGYDSDWAKGKDNCMNIHHFGKSFLGEMSTSPYLFDINTKIVLIGHSMGGLVIKKALMLAKQDAAYETLRERFHTIFFLATPHKGSDSAKLLNNVLQIAYSSRAYVADLERGSGAIQTINDDFRNYSPDIVLWSFYETQKLKLGVLSTLIVDPDSATLGYREERQIPMNADHRSICKFETPIDPNYVTLRNALASTVQDIYKQETSWHNQLRDIEKYLEVSETPEDDLAAAEDARRPAAGKTVLVGYTIRKLQKAKADCSYFFFKHGDQSKSRLSACLRSLAFQMARTNTEVRETLLEMQRDGIKLDNDNERTIWRKLFLDGIFQTALSRHYWVIDALDECVNFTTFFDPMLARLDKSISLRILITSREAAGLENHVLNLENPLFQQVRISIADTLPDIKLLVEVKSRFVALEDDEDRAALVEKVLGKSEGCFLWTVLVLSELSTSYGEEELKQALEDIPRDMELLYQRTLELMTRASRGKKLAKAVLMWATCAIRPLTIKELEGALKLDVKDNFPKLEESILALCGHLVVVDRFGKVQMVHGTAREFLLRDDLDSEFAINKMEAHTRIARACLTYLTGEEMKPPRTSRRSSVMNTASKRVEFSVYACAAFSYHLAKADPLANDVLILAEKFLKLNVLSWIDFIAQTNNLIYLIRAAKHLKTYLDSCSTARSPLGTSMQTIRGWTTDFIRIVAKFADALTTSPSGIYSLFPPFCPTESTVYKIANPGRRLSVVGLPALQWDDRLSCIDFHEGQTSAVCHGDEFFAVGLTTGTVALYHTTSCQEYKRLNHGETVKFLQFKSRTGLMASCGMKTIHIWDTSSGEIIHMFQAPQRTMGLAFDKNLLLAASSKNYLASWDLDSNGTQQVDRSWYDSRENKDRRSRRAPCAISVAVSHKMLAVAYSGRPIMLWDLEGDMYYGDCGKKLDGGETSTHVVTALVFNPNPNIHLLAASYLDGELVLLDPFNDQELESFRGNCHTLAASPDGRLLAGGAGSGVIQVYEFDTLNLLYRVQSSNFYIKQLAFSRDSLRFSDIRGSHCNVWEPAVLLRESVGDDSSAGTSTSMIDVVALDSKVKISAMVLHPTDDTVFCGKDDGSVCLYHVKTGAELRTLYRHKSLVRLLSWWPQINVIMSVDISNGLLAWNLQKSQKEGWVAEKVHFQSRLDCGSSIVQVLPGEAAGKFILSTHKSDHLWSIDGKQVDERIYMDRPGIRKWIQHQQSPRHMICIEGAAARIYAWEDWSEVATVHLAADLSGLQPKSIIPYMSGSRQQLLLELSELDGSPDTRVLHLFDAASFSVEHFAVDEASSEVAKGTEDAERLSVQKESAAAAAVSTPLLSPQLAALTLSIAHVVGFSSANRLVFLDNRSWICSADLEGLSHGPVSYSRHFFVPYDWFAGTRDVLCAVAHRDVLFARNDNVAIVKGGLEYAENVIVELR
ncbi:protein SERAC1, partial [Lecanoromycetidae sp. Uapishka_2]